MKPAHPTEHAPATRGNALIWGWSGPHGAAGAPAATMLTNMERGPRAGVAAAMESLEHAACAGFGARLGRDGDVLIAIAGTPDYRGERCAAGRVARLASDYRKRGDGVLTDLRGPFALAIAGPGRALLLAVDRLGIMPLFYAVAGETIVFGSRSDSVAAHPAVDPELDPQALLHYLYFHCVPAPKAIFSGQRRLLPAECVRFDAGRPHNRRYWTLAYQEHAQPLEPLRQALTATLEQSVARAAYDRASAAFLSGGLDSSTVAGYLARARGGPADAYSIGFDAPGYDEMHYARVAVEHFGLHGHEYYVTPEDVVGAIPRIAGACDQPFGNASIVAAYHCARVAAADGIDTMLAGDGGDELFGGNARYAKQQVFELYGRLPEPLRGGLIEPALAALHAERWPLLRKAASYLAQAKIPLPHRLEYYNLLEHEGIDRVLAAKLVTKVDRDGPITALCETWNAAPCANTLNRMLHLDLKFTLADNDLYKVNTACALAGVDVRYPMLDESVVELAARIPPAHKIRRLRLRAFYKDTLHGFLPAEILRKSKHGFGLPFGLWLSQHKALQTLAGDSLASLRRRDIVDPAYLDLLGARHRDQHAVYYGVMIWVLMMLEQWLQAHETRAHTTPVEGAPVPRHAPA